MIAVWVRPRFGLCVGIAIGSTSTSFGFAAASIKSTWSTRTGISSTWMGLNQFVKRPCSRLAFGISGARSGAANPPTARRVRRQNERCWGGALLAGIGSYRKAASCVARTSRAFVIRSNGSSKSACLNAASTSCCIRSSSVALPGGRSIASGWKRPEGESIRLPAGRPSAWTSKVSPARRSRATGHFALR